MMFPRWEVEGHSEKDEGAYFAGDFNTYDFESLVT